MKKLGLNFVFILAAALPLCFASFRDVMASMTLHGTVPGGPEGVIILKAHKHGGATDTLKFRFSAPQPGSYSLSFCIGPAASPCLGYVVEVPGGQERLAVIPAAALTDKVLMVGHGTNALYPFAVTME
jgi:hypothetical protein